MRLGEEREGTEGDSERVGLSRTAGLFKFKKFFLCLFTFERGSMNEQEKGRERRRHRILSRLQALSCQHRDRRGARIHGLRDTDLNRSQTLNPLSHPGAPTAEHFEVLRPRKAQMMAS